MLYGFLKLLFRITIRVFFRKVHIRNLDKVPDGPLLICSNHPSAFMDPIVVAALIHRRVFFLAKAEVFKTALAKKMLPKLNMVPVYRAQDDPTQLHKNQETFVKCFEHLGRGGAIMIFPEGTSFTERKLRKIKTGAARIALGAEENNNYSLGVKLLPVGLNYTNPHRFRQDLYIDIGEPIEASAYTERWKTEGFAAAEALTEKLRVALEKQIIAIEDEDTDKLVHAIEKLYKPRLMENLGVARDDGRRQHELLQRLVETVNYYKETDPARVDRMRVEIDTYLTNLDRVGLDDRLIARGRAGAWFRNFTAALLIVAGFPFWIIGTLINYLPFKAPSWLAKKIVKHPNFWGSVLMAGGAVIFLLWYIGIVIAAWLSTHQLLLTAGFVAGAAATGLFAFFYYRRVRRISRFWFLQSLFSSHARLIAALQQQRESIIRQLDEAAEEFRSKFGSIADRWNGKISE